MRKVRCIEKPSITSYAFTYGKIYDVIKYIKASAGVKVDYIVIVDDRGYEVTIRTTNHYFTSCFFEDVTHEYRNSIITEILE